MSREGPLLVVPGVGKRFKALIERRYPSTSAFIRESKIARQTVYNALRQDSISHETAVKAATVLGVDTAYLLSEYTSEPTGGVGTSSFPSPLSLALPSGTGLDDAAARAYLDAPDRIEQTIGTFPGGEMGRSWKTAFLGYLESEAERLHERLPEAFWDILRRVRLREL